jgi:hypothetical protein
MPSLQDELQTL